MLCEISCKIPQRAVCALYASMLVSSLPVAVAGLCGIRRSADMEPASANVRLWQILLIKSWR